MPPQWKDLPALTFDPFLLPSLRYYTDLEARKQVYQEFIIRRIILLKDGWNEKWRNEDEKQREHRDGIKLNTVCEAMNYKHPPEAYESIYSRIRKNPIVPTDKDTELSQAVARMELVLHNPKRQDEIFFREDKKPFNRIAYWEKFMGVIRELGKPVTKPFPDITYLHDSADFSLTSLLRILYLYGETPEHLKHEARKWREFRKDKKLANEDVWEIRQKKLAINRNFSPQFAAELKNCLLAFKYWLDEPFFVEPELSKAAPGVDDVLSAVLPAEVRLSAAGVSNEGLINARKDFKIKSKKSNGKKIEEEDYDEDEYKYEMTYWSENHQILFAAAEYLAGQMWPDEIFRAGRDYRDEGPDAIRQGDLTGAEHMSKAKSRLIRWLNDRLRFGFSEWNSSNYYQFDFKALFNLADFCVDKEIQTRASMVLDLLIFDIARLTQRGSFGVTAGRNYNDQKMCGWKQSVGDLIEVLFGVRQGIFHIGAAWEFASMRRYEPPDVLIAIGQDKPQHFIDRSRVSINFEEAGEYGIGFESDEDIMFWWGKSSFFTKQVIEASRRMAEKYKLMSSPPFKEIFPATRAVSWGLSAVKLMGYAAAGPFAPLVIPLLGSPFSQEDEVVNALSIALEGSSLTRANLYTYRNRDVMLSSVQNFRPGQVNLQSHSCQATLSPSASVWTTHPSAGLGFSETSLDLILGAMGASPGASIGSLLGGALGGFQAAIAGSMIGAAGGFCGGMQIVQDDLHLLPPSGDGPNWWTGSVTLPRVVQMGNAAIISYKPKAFQLLLSGHRFHAWFPRDAFDQDADADDWEGVDPQTRPGPFPTPMPAVDTTVKPPIVPSLVPVPSINSNIDTGAWIFGRVGNGYVALYSAQKPEWTTKGDWANREIMAEGKRNVFLLQVGSKNEFGSYINFKRKVLSARIHINGLHWAPADFQCSYDVPGGKRLELHYDEDKVRYAGFEFSDDEFPRYDNHYAQVAWQQNRYVIQHKGKSLIHDIQQNQRLVTGTVRKLVHKANLRIYAQNMGLFPNDLLGLPVTIFPLYAGTERDRAFQKLIEVLRQEKFDIVGLSEMWQDSDRKKIRETLGDIYKYSLEGPDEADLKHFSGGLLLLSRHKIINSNSTIYRQSVGEDYFANKGALHARIQVQGLPCPIDIFLTHTQGPKPKIPGYVLGSTNDVKQVIRHQIRHLAAFIHSCRDIRVPALLMGDLNVDGIHDLSNYNFLVGQLCAKKDLKPLFSSLTQPSKNFEATSEDDDSKVSSFNKVNNPRSIDENCRFGDKAQRLDYFFCWSGTIFDPDYPDDDRKVVIYQSSENRDMSDHYGIEVRLATISQKFVVTATKISMINIRLVRFWCLQKTNGPGNDEVEFTLRCVPDSGEEKSAKSHKFENVSDSTERLISSVEIFVNDPGEFLIVAVGGKEKDDLSADDSLGVSSLRFTRNELQHLFSQKVRKVLPRLMGDGGEYAVEIEIKVD